MRLLIVHPNILLRQNLAREFTRRKYQVASTGHGADALYTALTETPDLVILALDLPDIDGLTLIRQLRDSTAVPIIATTSTTNTRLIINALYVGADDVLTWPFSVLELIARSRAVLRRSGRTHTLLTHTHAGVTFDFALRHASRNGVSLPFTALEWRCLETFATAPRRLLTHSELIRRIWGVNDAQSHRDALRALIRRVRRTLRDSAHLPVFIETRTGVGYRWLPDEHETGPKPSSPQTKN